MINGVIIAIKLICLTFLIYLSVGTVLAYKKYKNEEKRQEIEDEELINRVKLYSSVNKSQLLTKGSSKEEYEKIQNDLLKMIDEAENG